MIRTVHRTSDSWQVLIKDRHEGYISWEEFARNQEIISDNANGKSYLGRGSVRRGEGLLPGLFRCGRCGRKLTVHYGSRGTHTQRYACRGAFSERAEMSCISFGGMRVDRLVGQEVLERVQPLGIEASLTAMKSLEREHSEKRLQLENALEQARFEAARAYRQYDASDPENRLVTAELDVAGTSVLSLCAPLRRISVGLRQNKSRFSLLLIETVYFCWGRSCSRMGQPRRNK